MPNNNVTLFFSPFRIFQFLLVNVFQLLRKLKYQLFSNIANIDNTAHITQPVLILGRGKVILGRCNLGFYPSPFFFNGYIHIEARETNACVEIESDVSINNNAVIIAERSTIHIGANTLIGTQFTAYDSDFHHLHPSKRLSGNHECSPIKIGRNVFIGSNVTVLKGVNIGDNSVIANSAVVTQSIPANCIAGGVPARIIRKI